MTIVYIESFGIAAPGIENRDQAHSVFTQAHPVDLQSNIQIPPVLMLPANERRRTTRTIKLALFCMQQLTNNVEIDPAAAVFASCSGDMDLVQSICLSLTQENKVVSPIQFHNSVHNAAAGYWSIGTQWMQETTSISAARSTFSAAILEAVSQILEQGKPVILCCSDIASPVPLDEKRKIKYDFGCALLLTPEETSRSLTKITLKLIEHASKGVTPGSQMRNPSLEALRLDNPAAAALPLLHAIDCKRSTTITLDYVSHLQLQLLLENLR